MPSNNLESPDFTAQFVTKQFVVPLVVAPVLVLNHGFAVGDGYNFHPDRKVGVALFPSARLCAGTCRVCGCCCFGFIIRNDDNLSY